MEKIVEQQWDYTKHARFYEYRPNYAPESIEMLSCLARGIKAAREAENYGANLAAANPGAAKLGANPALAANLGANPANLGASNPAANLAPNPTGGGALLADIGAGSGNLSVMLLERGFRVVALEPNDAMREIGIERTRGQNIEWVRAIGVESTLKSETFDWVTFGSSFNVMDRDLALRETHRILKKGGLFSCMWNHRDLSCPIQEIAQEIIADLVPGYEGGVRREDQRPILEAHRDLFDEIIYLEQDFYFHQSLENYINAWRSVKNKYWDVETAEGAALFERIVYQMRHKLPSSFNIKYTTRSWSAKKVG